MASMGASRKTPKVCEQTLSGFVRKSANWKVSRTNPKRAQASRLDLPMDFRQKMPGFLCVATCQPMGPSWASVEGVRQRLPSAPGGRLE